METRKWKTVSLDLISNLIHVVLQQFPRKTKQDDSSDKQASFTVYTCIVRQIYSNAEDPPHAEIRFTILKTTVLQDEESLTTKIKLPEKKQQSSKAEIRSEPSKIARVMTWSQETKCITKFNTESKSYHLFFLFLFKKLPPKVTTSFVSYLL